MLERRFLEFLLLLPDQIVSMLGFSNAREMIAITAWYLWWERHKLVHEEIVQSAYQVSMGICTLTTNFVIASSPKAILKREGWIRPLVFFVKLNVDVSFDLRALLGRF